MIILTKEISNIIYPIWKYTHKEFPLTWSSHAPLSRPLCGRPGYRGGGVGRNPLLVYFELDVGSWLCILATLLIGNILDEVYFNRFVIALHRFSKKQLNRIVPRFYAEWRLPELLCRPGWWPKRCRIVTYLVSKSSNVLPRCPRRRRPQAYIHNYVMSCGQRLCDKYVYIWIVKIYTYIYRGIYIYMHMYGKQVDVVDIHICIYVANIYIYTCMSM